MIPVFLQLWSRFRTKLAKTTRYCKLLSPNSSLRFAHSLFLDRSNWVHSRHVIFCNLRLVGVIWANFSRVSEYWLSKKKSIDITERGIALCRICIIDVREVKRSWAMTALENFIAPRFFTWKPEVRLHNDDVINQALIASEVVLGAEGSNASRPIWTSRKEFAETTVTTPSSATR